MIDETIEKPALSAIHGMKLFVRAYTHARELLVFFLLKHIILFHKFYKNIQIVQSQNG